MMMINRAAHNIRRRTTCIIPYRLPNIARPLSNHSYLYSLSPIFPPPSALRSISCVSRVIISPVQLLYHGGLGGAGQMLTLCGHHSFIMKTGLSFLSDHLPAIVLVGSTEWYHTKIHLGTYISSCFPPSLWFLLGSTLEPIQVRSVRFSLMVLR